MNTLPELVPFAALNTLTLRDYFATAALQGWLATYPVDCAHPADSRNGPAKLAKQAYALADAMLQAREKEPGKCAAN